MTMEVVTEKVYTQGWQCPQSIWEWEFAEFPGTLRCCPKSVPWRPTETGCQYAAFKTIPPSISSALLATPTGCRWQTLLQINAIHRDLPTFSETFQYGNFQRQLSSGEMYSSSPFDSRHSTNPWATRTHQALLPVLGVQGQTRQQQPCPLRASLLGETK